MKQVIDIPEELSEDFKHKWDEFCVATKKANLALPEDFGFLVVLKRVFTFSDFVARSCIRNPEMLDLLIKSGDLQRSYPDDEYTCKLKALLSGVQEEETLGRFLRRFRRREMVRIAWRDLSGHADLSETMAELSAFADACLDQALSLLYKWQCSEYGIPTGPDGSHQHLVVLGMGKLGGRELNFSSDIDLIFAYPEVGKTIGGEKSISNEAFFVRLCRRLINVMGSSSAEGILFRVDTRLRPYGESGPLVMSFDAMERYYQRQGREWERYAWIKARVVAGGRKAGAYLLERLKPFVYRRYLDFGAFESLRDMKKKIAFEVKRKGLENNVKIGYGGIREIEFFGQIFQLIRGGLVPILQEQSILKVLNSLARENYIPRRVCDELQRAYIFLRNTEHRLQEFSDQQTHNIPSDTAGRSRLAASMCFENWESFALHLANYRKIVHSHFNILLQTDEQDKEAVYELEGVWHGLEDGEQGQKVLSAAGFDKPDEVLNLLKHLRESSNTRALSREGRDRLDKLIPKVLKKVALLKTPSLTLNRIIELIKTIQRRTCYLALLLENPAALTHLVKLSNASPWIASFLARHPALLDELLDPRAIFAPPEKAELEKDLRDRLKGLPSHDLEYQMDELRMFKQTNTFRVAAADVTGALPLMKVSDRLTYIAETVLSEVLDLSWNHLVEKHGEPVCLLDGKPCEKGFVVIAYGKLGGIELGYGSDLDLVFLHAGTGGYTKGGMRPIDTPQFFARLGQRVLHILTAHTSTGILYETDMRLRPSGTSGLLVSHIEAFKDYQTKKAWTWEHQALVRARAICGNIHLSKYFEQIRKEVIARLRNKTELQKEVCSMRERMRRELLYPENGIFDLKQSAGGIVDIEFMIQYLVLLNSYKHHNLLKWTDNVRILQTLAETGIIDEHTANFLKEAYLTYRSAAHQLSLQEKPARAPEEKFRDLRKKVKKLWDLYLEEK